MRLLNWLKKDSKSKRRQSAPPIGQEFDPNATRNQEYIRALEKFNEWRSHQHLENSNQTSTGTNTSGSLLPISIPEDSIITELPMIAAAASGHRGKTNKRLSLPATSSCTTLDAESPQHRSQSRQSRREKRALKKANESSIMEERQSAGSPYRKDDDVRLFEELHCQLSAVDVVEDHGCNSPPNRFYKKNAKPYHERLFAKTPTAAPTPPHGNGNAVVVDVEYTTPQRRNNAPTKPTRRRKSGQSGPIPKIRNSLNCSKSRGTETDSMSEPSHVNGSYKNYDINSSSIYDEFVISSKAYKGNMNQSLHTYQQVVNKHGELVEYALPLVDDGNVPSAGEDVQPTVPATNPEDGDTNERIIDDNFKFLTDKCNLNFSDSVRRFIFADEPSQRNGNQQLQVTDLDKSELEKGDYQNRQEIFNELDALARWAGTIEPKTATIDTDEKFNLNEFLFRNDTIIVSYPKEVVCRTSVLRSSIPMPVELSSGVFRNTNVTVRKHLLEDKRSVRFSQEALRRDFSTLKQVRHADIVTLMAVVADRGANQMQLVLEPFDFTLNYYIHCQNNELSLANVMIVMQQMAQAVNYLQECGHIHSNISSHAILMRQNPLCVKLGFFELATDINSKARREIVSTYGNMMDTDGQDFNTIPDYSLLLRGSEKYVKEKYVKLSKNINLSKVNQSTHRSYPPIEVPSKYLPYFLEYRQQFSLYFYQPPELISTKSRFVLPNTLSDVYSLTLLLWELLNNCVPYVIYSYSELDKLYKTKQALLPRILPERCGRFEMVLKMGLEKDPVHRVMSIQDFVALLDDLKTSVPYDVVKMPQPVTRAELIEEVGVANKPDGGREKHNINEVIQPKLANKEPFTFRKEVSPKNNHYENLMSDPQLRMENAITNNISLDTFETKSTTTCADYSCVLNETPKETRTEEQEPRTIQRTNGELSGGLGKGFTPKAKRRASFAKCQKTIAKKISPNQKKNAVKRSADNLFNLSQSTIFNSVSDIGKATESPQQQFVAMERTSTLKRKKPVSRLGPHVANVFPSPKSRCNLEDQLQEMDKGLKLSKEDLLEEFKNSPKHHVDPAEFEQVQSAGPRVNPHKGMVARARANYMKRLLYNNNDEGAQGDGLSRTMKTPNNRIVAAVPKSVPASYKFPVEKSSLPQTPIARNNQLLKHAWLSDQKLDEQAGKSLDYDMSKSTDDILNRSFTIETQVAEELKARKILSVEKIYRNPNSSSCNISLDESFKEKNVNVNLKIIHNNLEIFNNSVTSPGELNQKIQKIQLGMFEKEGCDSSRMKKPEIKIRLTPAKNSSVALNDLNAENHPIGKQITDLTSEIRQCFENYSDSMWDEENKKLIADLGKGSPIEKNLPLNVLHSPKLVLDNRKYCDNEFRFENALWHKEKSICEKSSGAGGDNLDDTECEWISVPLAIKKFESISKSSSSGSPKMNKSVVNSAELSIVQQSRLPNGGDAENSPHQMKDLLNDIKDGAPVATSSPLVEENIRRFNSFLKPIRLMNNNQARPSLGGASTGLQCCSSRNVVRRATFNEGPEPANRSDRSRRITTKVTLNLKKVQPIGSVNSSRNSESTGNCARNESLVCSNCGTCVAANLAPGTSNANLSMSMISYSNHNKPFDKIQEPLSRRSSSCSTLLKMNPMDDLYIDDDFEDNSFLTPNIELVKNERVILFGD